MRIGYVLDHVTLQQNVCHEMLPSGTHMLVDIKSMLATTVACADTARSWLTYFGDEREQPGVVILPDNGYGYRVMPDFTGIQDNVNCERLRLAVTALLGP